VNLRRALGVGLAIVATAPASAVASSPVGLKMAFGDDARLGASTSMSLALRVDSSLAPVTEVRLLTPAGVRLTSSRLGAASCRRPAQEVARVLGPVVHAPCPINSLIGSGSASADLRLSEEETIAGAADIELRAGATVDAKPGLIVIANTYNPVRMQLTYAGYLYVPPAPFGVGLAIKVLPIPKGPFGAPVALSRLHLVVGGRGIIYYKSVHRRRLAYHPGGVPLPGSCPRGGFRFRVVLRFADATRRAVDDVVRCPPRRRQH
jgi:hypothetical protein